MRIATWNILHGGGRHRLPALLMALVDLRADVVVVTEARRRFAGQLAAGLADAGLGHALLPEAPDGVNAVLVVSREPVRRCEVAGVPECLRHRWACAELACGIGLIAAHLPEVSRRREHLESWRALVREARARRERPTVIAGDLNTWRERGVGADSRSGPPAKNLGKLASLGYADAWQAAGDGVAGATWMDPRGRAFRLDYVLVSGPLRGRIGAVETVDSCRARGLSDHAAVALDLVPERVGDGENACGKGKNSRPDAESPKKAVVPGLRALAKGAKAK